MLDLTTGSLTRLRDDTPTDFHLLTQDAGGRVVGLGLGLQSELWKYTPHRP
ncbi:MAG: hypothetical protein ACT4QD_03735 [Acidobacteriota bacterium]